MPIERWKSDLHKFVGKTFEADYNARVKSHAVHRLFGMATGDNISYELRATGGYSLMQKYDGVNLTQADESRGFITIIKPEEYSLSYDIGYKAAKIDKLGECRKIGAKLANSAHNTELKMMLDIFANAYTGTVKGGDGKAWAATDHPLRSVGDEKGSDALNRKAKADDDETFSNKINNTFTIAGIAAAQLAGSKILAPNGAPTGLTYDLVLVSPDLEHEAKKIFGVNGKFQPTMNPDGTANNQSNPVSDLKYMVCAAGNWGLKGKQWALADSSALKEVLMKYVITRPTVKQTLLDNPLISRHVVYMDEACGFGDARPIIFSDGEA